MSKNSYELGVSLLKELSKKSVNRLNVIDFINNGADLSLLHNCGHGKNQGVQAIIYAAQKDLTDIVMLMGEKGANLNAVDNQGNTPLHLAVQNGNKELVDYLLKQHVLTTLKNNENNTPYDIAISLFNDTTYLYNVEKQKRKQNANTRKTIEKLEKKLIHTNALVLLLKSSKQKTNLKTNQEKGEEMTTNMDQNKQDNEQLTKDMHQAAMVKKFETCVARLHHFTKRDKIEEYALKIQQLLDQGMDIDHPIKDMQNSTLLHVLCLKVDEIKFDKNGVSCDLTIPTVLRKYKPNPFAENKEGYTPMMFLSHMVENASFFGNDIKRAKKLNLHLLASYERAYQTKTIGQTLEPLAILATLYNEKDKKSAQEIVNKAGNSLLKLAFTLQGKHINQKEG